MMKITHLRMKVLTVLSYLIGNGKVCHKSTHMKRQSFKNSI